MIDIQKIDPRSKADVKRYIDLPYPLYRDNPNWVPFLRMDIATMLNADKHPFYEHSEAEFFIAPQGWRRCSPPCDAGKQALQPVSQQEAGSILSFRMHRGL